MTATLKRVASAWEAEYWRWGMRANKGRYEVFRQARQTVVVPVVYRTFRTYGRAVAARERMARLAAARAVMEALRQPTPPPSAGKTPKRLDFSNSNPQ